LRLPAGMTVEDAYYRGYRVTMRAVADLNRKNHYAKPLLSGGTACMWPQYKKNYMKNFLAAYAKDPDPAKHMDFLSVHYYVDDFAAAASFRHDMEALMAGYHLPAIPLIMSELGWKEPGAKRYSSDKSASLRWATGALSHAYEIAEQNIPPMHWVYPRKEDRMSMAAPANESPALLPKGNAVRMAQMLKQNHVKSTVSIDKNGYGVYSIATYDSDGIAILLFNYDGGGESVKNVTLHLLNADKLGAKSGSVTEYRLDRTHANYFADKNAWQLAPVGEAAVPLSALNGKTVQLNGNAAQLIVVTFPK